MNRQPTRDEVQRYLQQIQQLKAQYGADVVNVPEYTQLTKIIRYIQAQAMQRLQQMQQQQQQQQQQPQQHQQAQQAQQTQQPPQPQEQIQHHQLPLQEHHTPGQLPNMPNTQQLQAQRLPVGPGQPAQNMYQQPLQGTAPGGRLPLNYQGMQQQKPVYQQPMQPMQPKQQLYPQMGTNMGAPMSNHMAPAQTRGNSMGGTPVMGNVAMGPNGGMPINRLSPQSMNQMPPYSQPAQGFARGGVGMTPNGVQNGGMGTLESPFTPQQMQLLKLQNQAAKLLFKNQSLFLPIPQNIIDLATNERLAFSGSPASQTPQTPAMPAGQNIRRGGPSQQMYPPGSASQSPPMPYQQPPTPSQAPSQGSILGPMPQVEQRLLLSQEPRLNSPKRYRLTGATPKTLPKPDPSQTLPVVRASQAPVLFDEWKEDLTDKLVLPVSKPDLQVDTFVLPKVFERESKDLVPMSALYTTQSKLRIPSLMPYGVDFNEICSTREHYIALQISTQIEQLEKEIASTTDTEKQEGLKAELYQLQLLPHQTEIRGKVLSLMWFSKSLLPNSHPNFLAKFPELSIDNVITTEQLYRQQLYSLVQAQNKKHHESVSKILSSSNAKREALMAKKDKVERFGIKVASFHSQTAKEEQKKIERMAKQRLQALKLNDEEAYLKLLDHTKDARLTHLLSQTNQFLDTIAQAVRTQQRESAASSISGDKLGDTEELNDEKREKLDYYQVAHRIKEEISKQPSILVGGTLKEYQIKGLQWMVSLFNNHLNGILADEMGLGKTIQTISLLTYLFEVKKVPGPFLVIVPLSTLTNWNLEFEKWAPSLQTITYKGTPVQRKVMQNDIRHGNFQVLLTTFEFIIKDKALLSKIKWVHMIIDEGHRMKNTNSKLSETLSQYYHSDYRLILTGTPLQNNLPELWALLNFVLPQIFNSVTSFDEWFNKPFANTGGQDKIELSEEETLLIIRRLHKVLRPFLLRRLKKDVEKDLPNKIEKVVKCKMSALQSKLYRMMLKYNALFAGESKNGKKPSTIKNANNQLMQLRKICNHPFVYEEVENLINPTSETNDTIWRTAGKFELLDRILPKFQKTGHRVLIFFQMTQIMDIMEDFLRLRGMKYMRLDGGTKSDDRTSLLKLFNAPGSDYFCFLLSTRAGGLGLNLQSADTVIIFDSDWNPHQDLQAQDRAHRIGQKNEVRILRLITEDSIEEMILERAVAKLEIDGKVIQAGKFDNKSTSEEQEALLRALMEKEEERRQKSNDEDQDMDDDELNQIIARNTDELDVFKELDVERIMSIKQAEYSTALYSEQELPEIYQKDPQTFYKTDAQMIEEYGRGNRERKTAIYDDSLTEEEWLRRIEGYTTDESEEEVVVKKKGRPRKNDAAKRDASALGLGELPSKRARSVTPSTRGRKAKVGRPKLKTSSNRSTPAVDPLTPEDRATLQERMETIFQELLDYTDSERRLSDLFMVKPSKKLYPDYYVLIKHPLAFDTLRKRISNKTYLHVREFLEDVHLIFSNARTYNEEGSIVYLDALKLENLAFARYKELFPEQAEEWQGVLDFSEFDQIHLAKPLALAAKRDNYQPVQPSPLVAEQTSAGMIDGMAMKAPAFNIPESVIRSDSALDSQNLQESEKPAAGEPGAMAPGGATDGQMLENSGIDPQFIEAQLMDEHPVLKHEDFADDADIMADMVSGDFYGDLENGNSLIGGDENLHI